MNQSRLNILALYLLVFSMMGLSNTVVPILKELSGAAGAGGSSLIFSSYFIGAFALMLPLGIAADRYGTKPLIMLAGALTVLTGLIITVAESLAIITVARFVEGVASAAFYPASFAMLSAMRERERRMGQFTFLLNGGLAAGILLAGFLAGAMLKAGVILFTMLALIALISSLFIRGIPGVEHSGTLIEKTRREIRLTLDMLLGPRLVGIWLLSFILFGFTGVLIAQYPLYSAGFLGIWERGLVIGGLYIGAMLLSLVAGEIEGPRNRIIRAGLIISALGAFASVYHPLGMIIMGAGTGLSLVGLVTAIPTSIEQGKAMGLFNTSTYAGMAVVPLAAGIIKTVTSFAFIFSTAGVFLLLSIVISVGK